MAESDLTDIEEWCAIPRFEGYEASSHGRFRSLDRIISGLNRWGTVNTYKIRGRMLKPWRQSHGYLMLTLAGQAHVYAHVAIALTFIGPRPSPLHEVAHWDGDKTNNRKSNVRWATKLENAADSIRQGVTQRGELVPSAKLTESEVRSIKSRIAAGETRISVASMFGITPHHAASIYTGVSWAHLNGETMVILAAVTSDGDKIGYVILTGAKSGGFHITANREAAYQCSDAAADAIIRRVARERRDVHLEKEQAA